MSSTTNKDNTRAEEFKRATAGVLRAIAEIPDVQVAFQPGPSGLSGKRARLPLPTRRTEPVVADVPVYEAAYRRYRMLFDTLKPMF